MIVDVHGHWGPWFFAMESSTVDDNLRVMDAWGITLQIVSAAEAVVYDAPGGNARLAAVLAGRPRLRGYLVANPNNLAATEADLRRHLPQGRWDGPFVGVKVHTTYPDRAIASPQMRDLFAMLASYGAVALVHTWGPDVLDLVPHLEANPALRVIAAQMGAHRWDLAAEAALASERLYLEPSCSVTDAGQVAHVASRIPVTQLLFGTDATLIDPAVSVGLVQDARRDPATLEHLYWRNAAALFGLHGALERVASS